MLVDLHNHTTAFSSCSVLEPGTMLERAVAAGLDALAVTEHDHYFDGLPLAELERQAAGRIRLFIGIEHTLPGFHVLAFGERLGTGPWASAEELCAAAADRATALVLAHPWRWGAAESFPDEAALAAFLRCFHAIEVRSANLTPAQQAVGLAFCAAHGIPVCAGSDAHSPEMAATFATRFEKTLNNEAELADALRAGRCTPVTLSPS